MKPRNGVLVLLVAVVLGGLAGWFLLPDLRPVGAAAPTSAVPSTPSPTHPSTMTPTPTEGPIGEDVLITVQDFADQSVEVTYQSMRGATDPQASVSSCLDADAYEGHRTLQEVTGYDPSVEGVWDETATDDTADESVAVASGSDAAIGSVSRILSAVQPCERADEGQPVYGRVHTLNTSSLESSSWIGSYPGRQNTTGRAPTGVEPCGGLLLARNGRRFAVLHVSMCLDGVQLAGLAQAAAEALD